MPFPDDPIRTPYDPEAFRELGYLFVDRVAEYLADIYERPAEVPVHPWMEPEDRAASWATDFPEEGSEDFLPLLDRYLSESIHLHHPRYIGHQVGPSLPVAALWDMVVALINNGTTIYEMSPAATMMERAVVRWMSDRVGFGEGAGGVMVDGGAIGNLTALLAMRSIKAGYDVWEDGDHAGPPLAVLGTEQAHYSLDRAVKVMGWGSAGYIPVETDGNFRIQSNALKPALDRARRDGLEVVGVVANAGSTATGAIDPLEAIADFCEANDLWLHVDGAQGASLVLSEKYRSRLAGIERADSIIWDAHKMMLIPSMATFVLYRREEHSWKVFTQKARYVFTRDAEEEWYNLGHRTIECTKRTMGVLVYTSLQLYGTRYFGDYVSSVTDLAHAFTAMLQEAPDFEPAVEPEMNIVCFRFRPDGVGMKTTGGLDELQQKIRQRLLESGSFYITQTELGGDTWLRTTITNPITARNDLAELMEKIREVARSF